MTAERGKSVGADLSVMREVNRSLVLDLLRERSPISRADLAKATSLAKPTVSVIVDELLADGLVKEAGVGEVRSGGGRPPILLEFNAGSHFVCGVHVGVQRTTVAVADALGVEVARVSRPTPRSRPSDAFRAIASSISDALEAAGTSKGRLSTVGVCVPGLVDIDEGTCLLAPNLGWRNVAVQDLLSKRLGGVPVLVHNTAQTAAVAEAVEGAGLGAGELVLLYAGTGVGAGILHDGRIFHGAEGIAGEIGHCRLPGVEAPCSCGKVGCVETVTSAPAIADAFRSALAGGRRSRIGADAEPPDIAAAAAAGDELAAEVLAEAGRALGLAASWIVNVCNPEVLVVGGGLAGAGEALLQPLIRTVLAEALPQAADRVSVRTWALGQDAKVRGAVLLALQRSESYYRVIFQG